MTVSRVPTALAACLALAATALSASLSPARADTPPQDIRIRVVFFPVTGAPNQDVQSALEDRLVKIGDAINAANPLYNACVQNASARVSQSCEPASADIIISTALKNASKDAVSVTVSSVDLTGHRVLGSVSKTKDAKDDALTLDTVSDALSLSDAEIRSLIGTPVVRDGRLSTVPGYQPYLQLVPDMSSNDATYVAVLQNLLSKRGIASVPSQFNAGTITTGGAGLDALCGLGQRYLVYSIGTRSEDRPLSFNTRIQTRATGHLYDCPTKYDVSFGDTGHTDVPNTKFALAGLLPLLSTLFISKSNSWSNVTSAGGLVSNFVDVPSTAQPVLNHTAEITLQGLVDTFCESVKSIPTPAPLAVVERVQPTPAPAPRHTFIQVGSTNDGGTKPAPAGAAAASNSTPLDIGNFLADKPPALACTGDPFRKHAPAPRRGGGGG